MSQQIAAIDSMGQADYARKRFGYSPGKLAMWLFLASDAMGFLGLIGAYIVIRYSIGGDWVPATGGWDGAGGGLPSLDPIITGINTFVLILSSFTMVRALHAIGNGNQGGLKLWLGLTVLGGMTFLGVQVYEYGLLMSHGLHMNSHPYGGTFYLCTGFHGAHVLSGVIYLSCIWIAALRGKYTAENHSPVELVGLFWHFVDLVWIILFTVIYLI
jgi:heme/copper-type cytochrome/quinol oxidase subunit 3